VVHGDSTSDYAIVPDAFSCAHPGNGDGVTSPVFSARYTTDPTDPLGTRALYVSSPSGEGSGVLAATGTPSNAPFSARISLEDGSLSGFAVAAYEAPDSTDHYYLGHSTTISFTGTGWTTVGGPSSTSYTYTWDDISGGTVTPISGTSTLAAFSAAHGGDATATGGGAQVGFALGCGGQEYLLDDLQVGPTGSVTTYDFEGYLVGALIHASRTSTTPGGAVVVSGDLDPTKSTVAEVPFVLEAKPYGAAAYTQVGTSTYTSSPLVEPTLTVHPTTTTAYRWVIASSRSSDGATSVPVTVRVATAVTITAPAKAEKGKKFTVQSTTTPVKKGTAAVLQVRKGSTWAALKRGKTDARGHATFKVSSKKKGQLVLRVVVAAATGNDAGTSATRTVKVK
jgi:hypothetical protein